MKRKLTKNQQAYRKEINRLKDGLRKAESRGFIPDYNLIPDMPLRVTKKALEEIKRLKPRNIYIQGNWVDFETGEVITAHERVYHGAPKRLPDYDFENYDWTEFYSNELAEKIEAAFPTTEKGFGPQTYKPDYAGTNDIMDWEDYYNTIIENYKEEIYELSPTMQKFFLDWLNRMIKTFGKEDVAIVIESMAETIREFIDNSIYPSWQAAQDYMEAFENKLAEQLGEHGQQWLEDWREELAYAYT